MDTSHEEPLATVSYEWTEEYFSQFTSIMRGSMARWFPVGIFMCGITLYSGWNEYKGFSTSAIFKSYKMYQGLNVQFDFYDSYVVIADKYGSNKLPYELFYAIKSSKYGYVLCVSKVGGFFVPKSKCSEKLTLLIGQISTTVSNC